MYRFAPALIVAAAIYFSAENALQASCGDWLDHAAMTKNPASADSTRTDASDSQSTKDATDRSNLPCQGPNCRKAPQPFVPLAPVEITWGEVKAGLANWLADGLVSTGQLAYSLTPDGEALPGHPASIDRPPRV